MAAAGFSFRSSASALSASACMHQALCPCLQTPNEPLHRFSGQKAFHLWQQVALVEQQKVGKLDLVHNQICNLPIICSTGSQAPVSQAVPAAKVPQQHRAVHHCHLQQHHSTNHPPGSAAGSSLVLLLQALVAVPGP